MSTQRTEGRKPSPVGPRIEEEDTRRETMLEQLWVDLEAEPVPPEPPRRSNGGGGTLVAMGLAMILAGVTVTRSKKKR